MNFEKYFEIDYLKELYNKKLNNSMAKGIDKINSLSFSHRLDEELKIVNTKAINGSYRFSVFVEKLKLKGRNKHPRIISIPTLRDRIVLLSIKEILHDVFPECINNNLPNSYIRDIKRFLYNHQNQCYFLKLDIQRFYDRIQRPLLISMISERIKDETLLKLISLAINTPSVPLNTQVSKYEDFVTSEGIPQGLSISNILAQIYVSKLDQIIDKRRYFYRRYVDDIIILNKNKISKYRYDNIEKVLKDIGLSLNDEKKEEGDLRKGFTFLSYKITPNQISVADANVERFIRRVAGKFTWFKNGINNINKRPSWLMDNQRFKEVFIEDLNETITGIISSSKNYGWLFYFSEMNDESLLFKIDKIIRGFFSKLDDFNNEPPINLKKVSRAYRVIRHRGSQNYLCNFDNYNTYRRKREYLVFRGKIDPDMNYSDDQIDNLFENFRNRQIKNVEKDIGYKYF